MDESIVVSQLLDHSKTRWDISKLRSVFYDATVTSICRIPLPLNVRSDKWIWTKTVYGELSVKSAYWLGRSSNPPPNQDLLRGQIWKTRIRERLKMVLWRVATNCLPMKDKRLRYDANVDTICQLCDTGHESIIHLFINCLLARALWFKHRKVRSSPQIRGNRVPSLWLKPGNGSFKINVDAAVGAYHFAVAVIARDWRGELVFTCSKKVNTTLPLQADLWAVQIAEHFTSAPVMIEGDSQVCYRSITVQGMDTPWTIENIIHSVKSLASNLPFLSFRWVPREANEATHSLAKWSLLYSMYGSFDFGNSPC
ncbi:uncharacterized protein LOC142632997 [Castanea sativa]|uniref:uncharacterized protein LOC142632997 n=1 Tax=Castanea sativa TaxID=21020 RepID=UPI003F6502CA